MTKDEIEKIIRDRVFMAEVGLKGIDKAAEEIAAQFEREMRGVLFAAYPNLEARVKRLEDVVHYRHRS